MALFTAAPATYSQICWLHLLKTPPATNLLGTASTDIIRGSKAPRRCGSLNGMLVIIAGHASAGTLDRPLRP